MLGEEIIRAPDPVDVPDNSQLIASTSHLECSTSSISSARDTSCQDEEWPPRKQKRTLDTVPPGAMNFISSKFESLDFEKCENHLTLDEELSKGLSFVVRRNLARWLIFLLIGVTTAIIGALIDVCVEEISSIKFTTLKTYVDECIDNNCLLQPHLIWMGLNAAFVILGSVLVTYCEPVAAGSGIPHIKCYLNGVKIPNVVRIKTLVVKVVGVITSVVGGLACGKEGPMIHSGAVVGAGLSQGKSSSLGKDFNLFHYFREDCEKRDFVSGGAAAGVAAAFGAPVGGVLFSLEEGNSFWHQSLTWSLFFCSVVSTFTLNLILSSYHGRPGELSYAGLLNFGKFEDLNYQIVELPFFVVMGMLGGLLGAFFNQLNFYLTVFRIRYISVRCFRVCEAVLVAAATATVGFLMMYLMDDCRPLGQDPTKIPIQMYCGDGYYNALAALWFQTPEASVRSLFHDPLGSHKWSSVCAFFCFYLLLSCWTYGLSVSGGIFIPALLTGAAWGRLFGMGISAVFPQYSWADPGKYALVGAAAQLGGIVRMTLCLTVILIEATGNITFGLPLMITLITAKWTGDYFNEGIYDFHIQLQGVPVLGWEPPHVSSNVYASEVMSYPVTAFHCVESVGHVMNTLLTETHNGFPVVDPVTEDEEEAEGVVHRVKPNGRLRGLILRHQLVIIINNRLMYGGNNDNWSEPSVILRMFQDAYPRYGNVPSIQLTEEEMDLRIDLRPFMNQSPYVVQNCTSLPRVFRLFRGLGLRHLPVVNDRYEVVGMVTRKDLARYRPSHTHRKSARAGYEELKISQRSS